MIAHAVDGSLPPILVMPVAAEKTTVTSHWLVHNDAVEDTDYSLDEPTRLWAVTNLQGRHLPENNQRGVNDRDFVPKLYAPELEAPVERFVDWYCNKTPFPLEANS